VKVRIALGVKDARIVPEMGVRVAFLESKETAANSPVPPRGVLVPAEAIRQDGRKDVVYLLKDGHAERRAVSLGGTLGESREVQAGVSSGDSVIVEAPPNLKDGDAVEARETGDG
jgi:hypothetical protein